jgi:hypothetical protein
MFNETDLIIIANTKNFLQSHFPIFKNKYLTLIFTFIIIYYAVQICFPQNYTKKYSKKRF